MPYRLWFVSLFLIANLGFLTSGSGSEFSFSSPEARALADALDDSYRALREVTAEKPSVPRAELFSRVRAAEVEQAFFDLPRTIPIEDLFELRFAMSAWRFSAERAVSESLITFAIPLEWPKRLNAETEILLKTLRAGFRTLGELRVLMAPEHLSSLVFGLQFIPPALRADLHDVLAGLIVDHSIQYDSYTDAPAVKDRLLSRLTLSKHATTMMELTKGPCFPPGKPGPEIVPCVWGPNEEEIFERWSKRPELSQHAHSPWNPAAVLYRGVTFESGDLVLIDQSLNYDTGLNTSFSSPRSVFSHAGVFVNLSDTRGVKFPAVLEIADKGLRAVPLSIFIAPAFSHYSEVHRRKDRPADYPQRVEAWANQKLGEPFRYDFEVAEIDARSPNAINCASEEALVSVQCGLQPIHYRSGVNRGILPTLKMLGFDNLVSRGDYLTPTDYRRAPEMELVGVLDNRAVGLSLAKEFVAGSADVEGTVGYTLTHYQLLEDRLPAMYGAKVTLMGKIKNENTLALWIAGFKGHEKNFPAAPTKGLAFVTTLGDEVKVARHEMAIDIQQRRGAAGSLVSDAMHARERMSVHQLETDLRVRRQVQSYLKTMESWFGPPEIGEN